MAVAEGGQGAAPSRLILRIGVFEVDLQSGELRKGGRRRARLQDQPLKVLGKLAETPGELVTREALKESLWPPGVHLDREHGLAKAVVKLRAALGDSASSPRFIETIPRRGYRLLGDVALVRGTDGNSSTRESPTPPAAEARRRERPGSAGVDSIAPVAEGGTFGKGWSRHASALWFAGATFAVLLLPRVSDLIFVERRTDVVPRPGTSFQVTHALGVENFPTWSPDGGRIAYVSDRDGDEDIWVAQLAGEPPVNLTSDHEGRDRHPAWSPDGGQIAFVSDRDGGGVYVMSAIGGPASRLSQRVRGGAYFMSPQWSARGDELAYIWRADDELVSFVEVVSLASRESRRLPIPGPAGNRTDLCWSRDGRFFAYVRAPNRSEGASEISVLRVADGQAFPVSGGLTADWSPEWSRDARTLFFVSNRGGSMDLWKQPIAADGRPDGEASAVTSGIGMQVAELSADGRRLAYSKGRPVANVWRVPISTLERGEAVWADAEQITFDQAAAGALDLSPDGERLLLDSDRTGNWDVWVVPARGGDMRPVTVHRAPDRTPTWSPDGERVAFYSYRSGNRDIWVAPVEGGPAVKLTRDPEADMFPMWSPDGREIAFYSARAGSVNAFAMPASGGDVRALTSERTTEYFPQWSPDGAWLAFASNRVHDSYHVWRIPVSGGPLEQVTRQRAYFYRWSPDGTHLYYHSPGSRELWSVSLSDGVERPVTRFGDKPGRLGGLGLAVGDDYLYFTWENDLGDIWVMDLVTEGDE